MPGEFSRNQIHDSYQEFSEHISSINSSDANTAITFFNGFVNFCEFDEVTSTITSQYKEIDVQFDQIWNQRYPNGQRIFNVPPDQLKKCAFLYQLCLKIFNREEGFNYLSVGLDYFGSSHIDENIYQFNVSVIDPLHNCIRKRLNQMLRELPEVNVQPALPLIQVSGDNSRVNINSVDQSTNIVGNVNIEKFKEIEVALQQIPDETKRTECLNSLNQLKESVGTESYIAKYRIFMETIADHVTIIAPFLPYLATLLPN